MAQESGGLPGAFEWFLRVFKSMGSGREAQEKQARNALEKLCQQGSEAGKGFEPNVLAYHLDGFRRAVDAKKFDRPSEPLRYGKRDAQRLNQGDLNRIAERARKLQSDIQNLRKAPLILDLCWTGVIPSGDLLSQAVKDEDVVALKTLINLPSLVRQNKRGKTHLSEMDDRLWVLCRYIKATTGGWHDSLLADILGPLEIPYCRSAEALRNWRHRNPVLLRKSLNRRKK
jgi:hypothetical protein